MTIDLTETKMQAFLDNEDYSGFTHLVVIFVRVILLSMHTPDIAPGDTVYP